MSKHRFQFETHLKETGMLDSFQELERRLVKGCDDSGATLSGTQCHQILMAFAHQRGTEKAFEQLLTAKPPHKVREQKGEV